MEAANRTFFLGAMRAAFGPFGQPAGAGQAGGGRPGYRAGNLRVIVVPAGSPQEAWNVPP